MAGKTKIIRDPKTGRIQGTEKGITPEELKKAFKRYKTYTKKNPKIKEVPNTKTNGVIQLALEVPLTQTGFFVFCRMKKISGAVNDIMQNRDGRYEEFLEVAQMIDDECFSDCLTLGFVGLANNNLVSRKLHLAEKVENKTETTIEIDWNDV